MKAKRTLRSVALIAAGLLATSTATGLAANSANAASHGKNKDHESASRGPGRKGSGSGKAG